MEHSRAYRECSRAISQGGGRGLKNVFYYFRRQKKVKDEFFFKTSKTPVHPGQILKANIKKKKKKKKNPKNLKVNLEILASMRRNLRLKGKKPCKLVKCKIIIKLLEQKQLNQSLIKCCLFQKRSVISKKDINDV